MGKFVFRLAKVKKVRTIYEEQAKLSWAEANRRLSQAIDDLVTLKDQKARASRYGYNHLELNLRPAFYQYLAKLDRNIERQIEVIREAQKLEAEKRDIWMKTRQDKEMIQLLEEKQYQKFIYDQLQQEQKELDDITNQTPQT